jgi:hypothetical protein
MMARASRITRRKTIPGGAPGLAAASRRLELRLSARHSFDIETASPRLFVQVTIIMEPMSKGGL